MFGEKIRVIRELRGLSQENVALKLGIAQNSYSKIERNETKLTTEMMTKIAAVLDVSPMDIITNQPAIINFQPNQGTQHSFGFVENYISNQKELMDKLLASKDEEIARLQKTIDSLIAKR
ncbi:helix-turn-helix transcriptional regulator [Mucilaginibacter sp. HMF5004]|uniref:helix-turn-helix domain-containing protein n=1 Tax=Mucilaginibacter rivuli TaxID=2857527 RepID=UPI001C5F04D5|nr:helix-turn-helix transcriptional regulator [Mucilaginibacter rivuli]MBW4891115.1 helix-turn-helix transcriptional regulator [Mucilaginibacter rivuli]